MLFRSFHEGINFAAIWTLPAIFLCENNGYAVSTPIAKSAKVANIADRAAGYGIPGVVVDGQDVLAVNDAMATAVQRARAGEGATLIEAKTYRYYEHAANMGRDLKYRTDDEIERWRRRDPLKLFAEQLTGNFKFKQGELDAIEEAVIADVEDSIKFAKDSPLPDDASAWTDVFAPAA